MTVQCLYAGGVSAVRAKRWHASPATAIRRACGACLFPPTLSPPVTFDFQDGGAPEDVTDRAEFEIRDHLQLAPQFWREIDGEAGMAKRYGVGQDAFSGQWSHCTKRTSSAQAVAGTVWRSMLGVVRASVSPEAEPARSTRSSVNPPTV